MMLKNLALDYSYLITNISTTAIFNKVYKSIQTYFKGVDYKKTILFK